MILMESKNNNLINIKYKLDDFEYSYLMNMMFNVYEIRFEIDN